MPAIRHLTQLTQLELHFDCLDLSASSWTQLTALQSLTCDTFLNQPQHLTCFTQLRALSVECPGAQQPGVQRYLSAISQMPLLTALHFEEKQAVGLPQDVAAADFTALTASSNMRSLRVGLAGSGAADGCILFQAGTVFPQLHVLDLLYRNSKYMQLDSTLHVNDQQVRQLCSSCPALDTLAFKLSFNATNSTSATALLPLLQLPGLTALKALTALTSLQVHVVSGATAAAAVLDIAAQLTGLKQLQLRLPHVADSTLMHCTTMRALENLALEIRQADNKGTEIIQVQNKVCVVLTTWCPCVGSLSEMQQPLC
jgi:hypothetical protein